MGYNASVSGNVYLRPLTEEEKEKLCKELGEKFGYYFGSAKWPEICGPMNESYVTESDDGIEIQASGYDRYHEDDWEVFYSVLKPYIDFAKDNSFEFVGEDDSLWRLRFVENGVVEDSGLVVYDNEIPYAVCISEGNVRDAQARYGSENEDDPASAENDEWDAEDAWGDCSGPIFVKMVRADSKEEAVRMVAEKEGYNPSILTAYTC